jgi:hypothetical protein
MNDFDNENSGLVIDEKGKVVRPPKQRPISLTTALDVRRELQRVYSDARRGNIPTGDATRLAYILNIMKQTIETTELEARLIALEQQTNNERR